MLLEPKQTMSSFDLIAIVNELKEIIQGSRIENIYQTSPLTLLFSLHSEQRLIIEAGKRVHLTKYDTEKPPSPSLFCQNLRKYLRGGIIQEVRTEGFERIVILTISQRDTSYKLVTEIFGRGNTILLDDNGRILHALSYRRMRDRDIIRGEVLKSPPARGLNPLEITIEQLAGLKNQKSPIAASLTNLMSIGGLYAEEILQRAQIDKTTSSNTLVDETITRIYNAIMDLSADLSSRKCPQIVMNSQGRMVDALPFSLKIYRDLKVREFPTFNEAADEYFTKIELEREDSTSSKGINLKIDEQRRVIHQQQEHFKKLEEETSKNQLVGDLINIHSQEIQSLLDSILSQRRSGEEWNQIISDKMSDDSVHFLESFDLKHGMIQVKIEETTFDLDLQETVYRNASRFYKAAKEAKEKIEGLKIALTEAEAKIKELMEIEVEVEKNVKTIDKLRERSWFEKFHWANSSEGFLLIGGRDASTNELLIRRHMSKDDIAFHADFPGSPFVLIKTDTKPPSEQTLNEAAQISASYSRAWREGVASLDIYWVKPDQVSKSAPSGEYLSRGMFMIHGQKNYIKNVPLRVCIGFVEKEDLLTVIGGPPSAIASQTRYRVELVPGRQSSGKLAKSILGKLAAIAPAELRPRILKLSLDEIQKFIPAGGGQLL
ncbi:MAG: hypothetical protein QG670_1574 [Thermoproteota archaeon]|nr:hypothetical protein [Thermoproteota archaeon]